jgi:bisphosphoglycerate-independent phosphoglycerate mutase (AlkP superfamily)
MRTELRDGGELADLVPTALAFLELKPSAEMTGKDLMNPKTPS